MLNGVLYIFTIDSRKLGRKKWKNAFDLSRTLDHRSKLKKKIVDCAENDTIERHPYEFVFVLYFV